jgi:hypothetical protein
MRDFRGPKGRKEALMKDPGRRNRHRSEKTVAKLRQDGEAQAKGTPSVKV